MLLLSDGCVNEVMAVVVAMLSAPICLFLIFGSVAAAAIAATWVMDRLF
jgi:hypothetical protein